MSIAGYLLWLWKLLIWDGQPRQRPGLWILDFLQDLPNRSLAAQQDAMN
jgi:hypothetical protein